MGTAIPLKRIAAYALDELERAVTLAAYAQPSSPSGAPRTRIDVAEIVIAFATADGSSASPATVVVGEVPLYASELRARIEPLDTPVLVSLVDLVSAPKETTGRLVLRVQVSPRRRRETEND